jgi:hypothetical protein
MPAAARSSPAQDVIASLPPPTGITGADAARVRPEVGNGICNV